MGDLVYFPTLEAFDEAFRQMQTNQVFLLKVCLQLSLSVQQVLDILDDRMELAPVLEKDFQTERRRILNLRKDLERLIARSA